MKFYFVLFLLIISSFNIYAQENSSNEGFCIENWIYTEFSECNNEIQSRNATDRNNCGSRVYLEPLSQTCDQEENLSLTLSSKEEFNSIKNSNSFLPNTEESDPYYPEDSFIYQEITNKKKNMVFNNINSFDSNKSINNNFLTKNTIIDNSSNSSILIINNLKKFTSKINNFYNLIYLLVIVMTFIVFFFILYIFKKKYETKSTIVSKENYDYKRYRLLMKKFIRNNPPKEIAKKDFKNYLIENGYHLDTILLILQGKSYNSKNLYEKFKLNTDVENNYKQKLKEYLYSVGCPNEIISKLLLEI